MKCCLSQSWSSDDIHFALSLGIVLPKFHHVLKTKGRSGCSCLCCICHCCLGFSKQYETHIDCKLVITQTAPLIRCASCILERCRDRSNVCDIIISGMLKHFLPLVTSVLMTILYRLEAVTNDVTLEMYLKNHTSIESSSSASEPALYFGICIKTLIRFGWAKYISEIIFKQFRSQNIEYKNKKTIAPSCKYCSVIPLL